MSTYFSFPIPDPPKQGFVVSAIAVIFMLMGKAGAQSAPLFAWMTSGAFLLLFLVFNNVLAIFADNFAQYAQRSMLTFLGVLLVMGLAATLISGKTIYEAEPYRTIYIVMIMAYFSLLTICFLIRNIADYLRDRDEQIRGR